MCVLLSRSPVCRLALYETKLPSIKPNISYIVYLYVVAHPAQMIFALPVELETVNKQLVQTAILYYIEDDLKSLLSGREEEGGGGGVLFT